MSPKTTVYRLRGIPQALGTKGLELAVREVLGLTDNEQVDIKSLASSPYRLEEKIATLVLPETCFAASNDGEWRRTYSNRDLGISSQITLDFDVHFHGFTPLHSDRDDECQIDLIAVSGLGGHAFGSFKERGGDHMWLRDSLAHDLPGVRIFVYGYGSVLAKSDSSQTILDLGRQLQMSIHNIHRHQPQDPMQPRPIILIGHSLGGILIKEALIQMSAQGIRYRKCLESVRGLAFFGVPSQGMEIQSLIPMVGKDQPNRLLLESLSTISTVLRHQTEQFRKCFGYRDASIVSFYETSLSPTAREVAKDQWKMVGPPALLVNYYSATNHRGLDETKIPVSRTHSDMVKFKSRHEEYYQQVLSELFWLTQDACTVIRKRLTEKLSSNLMSIQSKSESDKIKEVSHNSASECLRSLAFEEQYQRRNNIETVQTGCDWLEYHSVYRSWMKNYPDLLWIKGKPGAGKSTLMKYIVNRQESQASASDIILSFFFSARGTRMESTPFGMVQSLLHQLLPKLSSELSRLARKFELRLINSGDYGDKWKWSMGELKDFLYESILAIGNKTLYIYVDALDEAGDMNARMVTDYFRRLIGGAKSKELRLRICFSCRHYPIIAWSDGLIICVEEQNSQAIEDYAATKLGSVFKQEHLQQLQGSVERKADGVFLWVVLVVSRLLVLHSKGKSFKQIRQSLDDTPSDLNKVYDDVLPGADDEELEASIRLFQWLCFAHRPLTITELQHAICFDTTKKLRYVSEYVTDDEIPESEDAMKRRIIDLSRGLVEFLEIEDVTGQPPIDASNNLVEATYKSPASTVQLIHLSVKDYLIRSGFKKLLGYGTQSSLSVVEVGHDELLKSCIGYLRLEDRYKWRDLGEDDGWSKYPLVRYATLYWMSHARSLEKAGVRLCSLLDDLEWPASDVFRMWQTQYADWKGEGPYYDSKFYPGDPKPPLLHFAAYEGLTSVVEILIQKHHDLLNELDRFGCTALHWAILGQRQGPARLLIKQSDLAANHENHGGTTPMHLAAYLEDVEIAQLLLQRSDVRASLNQEDKLGTPLRIAFRLSHIEMMALLLFQDETSVDLCDRFGRCALHYAGDIMAGRTIASRIVRKGPTMLNKRDLEGRTPLYVAAQTDNIQVVNVLLQEKDIDVNLADNQGQTPLHAAIEMGHVDVVKSLLGHPKMDVNAVSSNRGTPIVLAMSKGYSDIEKLIREAGG